MRSALIDTLPSQLKRAKKTPAQARSKATVATIWNTAKKIIIAEGIQSLTTNKIVEQSQITIGSIYQYYEDKEAIAYEIFSYWLEGYIARYQAYSQANADLTDAYQFFTGIFALLLQHEQSDDHKLLEQLNIAIQSDAQIAQLDKQHNQRFCELLLADAVRLGITQDNKAGRQAIRFGFLLMLQACEIVAQAKPDDRTAYIGYIEKMTKIWLDSLML